MAVFVAVVRPASWVSFSDGTECLECRAIRCNLIDDETLEHFTIVIDGAPEVEPHAVDLHENLVEIPAPFAMGPHGLNLTPTDFGGEDLP